jgi:hypothetical protein
MIEAVENHMPEVIAIDEIGTELEAMAASTIAQRGVQLVGTAHGVAIESIIKNPCLQMLVGGIEVHIIYSLSSVCPFDLYLNLTLYALKHYGRSVSCPWHGRLTSALYYKKMLVLVYLLYQICK